MRTDKLSVKHKYEYNVVREDGTIVKTCVQYKSAVWLKSILRDVSSGHKYHVEKVEVQS